MKSDVFPVSGVKAIQQKYCLRDVLLITWLEKKRRQKFQIFYQLFGKELLFQLFINTVLAKIFQTNCSFSVKQHPTGKVQFVFFKNFLLVLEKF